MIPRYDETGRFPCVDIDMSTLGSERLGPEPLGSRSKFWMSIPGVVQPWLFKCARQDTGEHWAEKVGSELASLLKIPAARVEIAKRNGLYGVLIESIVPHTWNDQINKSVRLAELVHGNEVLAGYIEEYDRDKLRGQTDHTYKNIIEALKVIIPEDTYENIMTEFAGILVLDALIGNTDRHHENWALLRELKDGGRIRLAPSYDHASSLGRELQDAKRKQFLNSGIEEYIKKGRGAIFKESGKRHAENPLELVRWATNTHPSWFRPWLGKVQSLTQEQTESILKKIPEPLMSQTAKDFCAAFLCYTIQKLKGM